MTVPIQYSFIVRSHTSVVRVLNFTETARVVPYLDPKVGYAFFMLMRTFSREQQIHTRRYRKTVIITLIFNHCEAIFITHQ